MLDSFSNNDMVNIYSPQPKKNPLRSLPKLQKRNLSLAYASSGVQNVILLEEELTLTVSVKSGVSASLFLSHKLGLANALAYVHVVCHENAHIDCHVDIEDGKRIALVMQYDLQGCGSSSHVSAMFHGTDDAHQSMSVVMHHENTDTKGTIAIRGVFEQKSKGLFSGLIKVNPQAQKTDSYFRDDILLLDDAIAESLPTLEIEANDVRASHGSTTSHLNEDQMFYLQSRGLDRAQSRKMIINGFLGKIDSN